MTLSAPNSTGEGTRSLRNPDRLLVAGLGLVIVALFVFGLVLRIWMVDHLPINSDQAVAGLMSLGILHGHFGAVTWGQAYGGVEPYVTSVLFAIFGHSDTTLNMTPVVLSFTASCLVYRIGRYYLPRIIAGLAAVAVWVWPAIVVSNSTQELGYRFACLNLGLLAVLFAIRLRERGSTLPRWGWLGLALGACLWANPECIYFLVPCAVLLAPGVVRGWKATRTQTATELLCGLAGVIVGGLPFLWTAATNRSVALAPYPGTVATRWSALMGHAAPLAFGTQVPGTGSWYGGRAVGMVAFLVVIVALVLGVAWAVARHRPRTVTALVAFVVAYPIIYVLLPGTWYWRDGRYIVYLPFLLIVVGLYPLGLASWRRLSAAMVVGLVLAAGVTTAGEVMSSVPGLSISQLPHAFVVSRGSLTRLARVLEQHRARLGYAAYWVAYNLDFESHAALTFTPVDTDVVRNTTYLHRVGDAAQPAWLLCKPRYETSCGHLVGSTAVNPPGLTWTAFTSWLHRTGISFTTFGADGFTAVVPAAKVTPARLRRAGVMLSS